MAEIHVEKKRGSMGWLWLLVLLIVLALVGWWLWQSGMLGTTTDAVVPGDTISMAPLASALLA